VWRKKIVEEDRIKRLACTTMCIEKRSIQIVWWKSNDDRWMNVWWHHHHHSRRTQWRSLQDTSTGRKDRPSSKKHWLGNTI
jgi:hypothetical protein